MIDSRAEFWNAFLATFSKKTLEPAFKAGWATFMALESPEAQEEFTRIATGLKITPRQLRKMAPRRRAQLLLPQLTRGDLCLLYTSPSPRDKRQSRMPSSA